MPEHSDSPHTTWLRSAELWVKFIGLVLTLAGIYYGVVIKINDLGNLIERMQDQATASRELQARLLLDLSSKLDKTTVDYTLLERRVDAQEQAAAATKAVNDNTLASIIRLERQLDAVALNIREQAKEDKK